MSLQGYPWPLCFPYLRDFDDDGYAEYVEEEGEEEGEGGEEKEKGKGCRWCPRCWGYEDEEYEDFYLTYPGLWLEVGLPWGWWG